MALGGQEAAVGCRYGCFGRLQALCGALLCTGLPELSVLSVGPGAGSVLGRWRSHSGDIPGFRDTGKELM